LSGFLQRAAAALHQHLINSQGRTLASYSLKNGVPALVRRSVVGSGIFNAVWDDNGRRAIVRLNNVR
jgi:hypothetical protein